MDLKKKGLRRFSDNKKGSEFLDRYPKLSAYRFSSFFRFFDRVMPAKVLHKTERRKLSPEQIAKMGLTPQQLRKLAGIDEEVGEVGVADVGDEVEVAVGETEVMTGEVTTAKAEPASD